MDDTFHINPNSRLAHEAAEEVRGISQDTWVAVRGQVFNEHKIFYGVFALAKGDHPSRYMWKCDLAGDWLAEYEKSIAESGVD